MIVWHYGDGFGGGENFTPTGTDNREKFWGFITIQL